VLLAHPSCGTFRHDGGLDVEHHPERPERVQAAEAELERRGWLGCRRAEARPATLEQITAVHPQAYVDALRTAAERRLPFGSETAVTDESLATALYAAGGACALAEALLGGDAPTGFSLMRPPGHHADGVRPQGFCLLNSVAVAARHALDRLGARRVFILDWDVHHGNGTNEIFRNADAVLFASIHQAGLYPGTGPLSDAGSGPGEGYTINLPVPAGSDGEVWRSLVEHVVVPAAEAYRPDLVLISAGYDAHRDDPLAGCLLETEDFADMARHVRDLGARCGAPVGAVLEGGYDVGAVASGVVATLAALGGEGEAEMLAPDPIHTPRAASFVSHYWHLI